MRSSTGENAKAPRPEIPAGDRSRPEEQVAAVELVHKPWGHEEIFAVLEGSYVGKALHIAAGGVLSLQQHRVKDETIAVQSGQIQVDYGPDRDHLRTATLVAGAGLLIRAHVVHRIRADVDSIVLETATAHPGWRTDVVRHEDQYGRAGTNLP